ncbi:LAFA_0B06062g1_1 [Lachancea sp. 'fantastica']|nr:LAFA_0B06062g1_1 [Lachancea sp. 'fantastica']
MAKSHLIIVPCHSIWKIDNGLEPENYGQSSKHWFLAPFQYEGRDHLSFVMHSLLAIEELLKDTENSLLLFSGSCTKKEAGNVSEAHSYFLQARKLLNAVSYGFDLPATFTSHKDISRCCHSIDQKMKAQNLTVDELFAKHIEIEGFALDSLDNLLYSLVKFKDLTSNDASRVTLSGFGFKKRRFLELHAGAIDYPAGKINYISYEPKPISIDAEELEKYAQDLEYQEMKNALVPFKADWYALRDPLVEKKQQRNVFNLKPNYKLPFDKTENNGNDYEFFKNHVQHKMPWSSNAQI